MITILFLMVLFLLVISYATSKDDIIAPDLIMNTTFLIAILLAMIYSEFWALPMHLNSVIIIVVSLFFFMLGSKFTNFCITGSGRSRSLIISSNKHRLMTIKTSIILVMFFVGIVFTYMNMVEFYRVARTLSDSNNLSELLPIVLHNIYRKNAAFSRFFNYRVDILECFALVTTFAFLYNSILFGAWKKSAKYLLTVPPFFAILFFTGGRHLYLHYFIFVLMVSIFLAQFKMGFGKIASGKLVLFALLIFGFFCISFVGIGIFNGKIHTDESLIKPFFNYDGANIIALDVFINERFIPDNLYIGTMTLEQFYSKLKLIGVDIPVVNSYITDFALCGDVTTNCYTAFRRYVQDYGIFGNFMIMALLGIWFTSIYDYLKFIKFSPIILLLYAEYSYPLFLTAREEMFFTWQLTTTTVYKVVLIWLLFKLVRYVNADKVS